MLPGGGEGGGVRRAGGPQAARVAAGPPPPPPPVSPMRKPAGDRLAPEAKRKSRRMSALRDSMAGLAPSNSANSCIGAVSYSDHDPHDRDPARLLGGNRLLSPPVPEQDQDDDDREDDAVARPRVEPGDLRGDVRAGL